MTNSQEKRRTVSPPGQRRAHPCLFLCGSLLLILLPSLPGGADDNNAGATELTNNVLTRSTDTNSAIAKDPDTNSLGLSNINAASSAEVKTLETNSIILTPVDTNLPALSATETSPVVLREARSPARLDLESFRIIWERNIFNPNRSPYNRFTRTETRREPGRRRRIESFALVGTMSYEKGRFAFFEGSISQYQKVLEASNTIGDYTISEITTSHVKLQGTNGQAIEMPVGMQMKREEEGEWMLSERAETPETVRTSLSTTSSSSGGSSEALKRLLERREQEAGSESTNMSETALSSEEKTEPAEQTDKTEKVEKTEKPETPAPVNGAEEVLRRLLQKREQEVK